MSRPHWTPAQRTAKLATLDRHVRLAKDPALSPAARRKHSRWAASLGEQLGVIRRPKVCEGCRRGRVMLERHHADHSDPLGVTWLCRECHSEADRDCGSSDVLSAG